MTPNARPPDAPVPSREAAPDGKTAVADARSSRLHPARRWLWWLLAWLSLVIGLLGIFVPGLPTAPFVLLSGYAAARGSERLHRWLLAHARFGPMIRDWQVHGAVSRRAKVWASLTMVVSAGVMLAFALRSWMALVPIACMGVVALWLWRRPEPPR